MGFDFAGFERPAGIYRRYLYGPTQKDGRLFHQSTRAAAHRLYTCQRPGGDKLRFALVSERAGITVRYLHRRPGFNSNFHGDKLLLENKPAHRFYGGSGGGDNHGLRRCGSLGYHTAAARSLGENTAKATLDSTGSYRRSAGGGNRGGGVWGIGGGGVRGPDPINPLPLPMPPGSPRRPP